MIGKLHHLVRWDEWYDSKLPLMAAAIYHMAIRDPRPWPDAVSRYGLSMAFCALFLAYGYAINDYSDIEVDRRAGKVKAMAGMSRSGARAFLLGLILLGSAVLVPYYQDWRVILSVVSCYALGTAYSLPPIRLKERGMAGLAGAALAQRSLPVLVIASVWDSVDLVALGWASLGFMVGLRYILIHQYQDLEADLRSNVVTFATKNPALIVRSLYVTLGLEVTIVSALCLSIALSVSLFWIVPLGYLVYSAGYYILYRRFVGMLDPKSFDHVPLVDLYGIFLPIALVLFLASGNILWLILFPVEIIWKKRVMEQYLLLPYRFIVSLWHRVWQA